MCYQVFYLANGETKTYLSQPVTEEVARRYSEEFDNKYYNKRMPGSKKNYPYSRSWVGRSLH